MLKPYLAIFSIGAIALNAINPPINPKTIFEATGKFSCIYDSVFAIFAKNDDSALIAGKNISPMLMPKALHAPCKRFIAEAVVLDLFSNSLSALSLNFEVSATSAIAFLSVSRPPIKVAILVS